MNNLVPTIVQDAITSKVLMLGYMNQESLSQTLSTEIVTFYSRSKQRLWTKGETSGNYLNLSDLTYDCDADCILALVKPDGPTCHKGTETCFEKEVSSDWDVIKKLENIILERSQKHSEDSYTAQLLGSGINRIAQKVGEEAVEVVIAALGENKKELSNELADLLFHILVLLRSQNLSISDVLTVLKERMA